MTLLNRPPTSLLHKARKKRGHGHWRRALRLYRELCDVEPEKAENWRERGEVELKLGRSQDASASMFRCAELLAQSGDFVRATELIERAVEIDDSDEMRAFLAYLRRRAAIVAHQESTPNSDDDAPERVVVNRQARVLVPSLGVSTSDYKMVARAVLANPIFSELRSDHIRQLFDHSYVAGFAAGAEISFPPSSSDSLLMVAEGMVSTISPGSDTISHLLPGDLLQGDGDAPAPYRRASIDSAVLVVGRAVMDILRQQSPRLGRRVDRLMLRRKPHLHLAAHELFRDMEPGFKRELLRRISSAELPPGIDVTRTGDRVDALYIVLGGDLKVTSDDGTVGALRTGDLFGQLELIAGRPTATTVTTESPARLAEIPRALFNEIMATQPQLLAQLNQVAIELPGQPVVS